MIEDGLDGPKHSKSDDLVGIISGTYLSSLGIFLLKSSAIITGGTAGLSLLLSYLLPFSFSWLYFSINLPFFIFAISKKGWNFTIRSTVCVLLVSVLTSLNYRIFARIDISPVYAAISGNILLGVGLLILFRHHSSLGGFNIVALVAQDKLGWRAGYVQLALDGTLVLCALSVVSPTRVLLSAIGVFILNIILAKNHKPGRYLGY